MKRSTDSLGDFQSTETMTMKDAKDRPSNHGYNPRQNEINDDRNDKSNRVKMDRSLGIARVFEFIEVLFLEKIQNEVIR